VLAARAPGLWVALERALAGKAVDTDRCYEKTLPEADPSHQLPRQYVQLRHCSRSNMRYFHTINLQWGIYQDCGRHVTIGFSI
jgi:hypothetical protein